MNLHTCESTAFCFVEGTSCSEISDHISVHVFEDGKRFPQDATLEMLPYLGFVLQGMHSTLFAGTPYEVVKTNMCLGRLGFPPGG